MTLDDAFGELGIDRGVGSDGARRAYLRLLKTRKPETDPAGFMRLREAYEQVKGHLAFLDRLHADAALDLPPAVEYAEVTEEAAAVVDDTVEDAEEAPAVAPSDVVTNAATLERALLTDDFLAAGEALHHLCLAATAGVDGPSPPAAMCLHVILALHRINAVPAAHALLGSFQGWLTASGREARVVSGQLAVLLTIVRELDALPPKFPSFVRVAAASAVLEGDMAGAQRDLARLAFGRPRSAYHAAVALRANAPVLAAALAPSLDAPMPAPELATKPRKPVSSGYGGWGLIGVVIAVLRMLTSLASSPSSTPAYTPPAYVPAHASVPAASTSSPKLFDDRRSEAERLNSLSEAALTRANMIRTKAAGKHAGIALEAESVASALVRGDCRNAQDAATRLLDAAIRDSDAGSLRSQASLLEGDVLAWCMYATRPGASPASDGPDAGPREGIKSP